MSLHFIISRHHRAASSVQIGFEISFQAMRFTVSLPSSPKRRQYFASLSDAGSYAAGVLARAANDNRVTA